MNHTQAIIKACPWSQFSPKSSGHCIHVNLAQLQCMWPLHNCTTSLQMVQLYSAWFSPSCMHDSALATCKWLTNNALSCLAGSNGDTACQWFSQDAMAGSMHTWETSRQWCWRHTHVTMHLASCTGGTLTMQPRLEASRHWQWLYTYLANPAGDINVRRDPLRKYLEKGSLYVNSL